MADARTKIILEAVDNTSAAFNSAKSGLKGVSDVASTANRLLATLGVGLSVSSISQTISAALTAYRESEQSISKLDGVLRATGYSAGLTKKELKDLADQMQRTFGFDDKDIRRAEAELLKFRVIGKGTFEEALKLSADWARMTGTDLPSAAAQLGKSLAAPESAARMLKEAGVVLTDNQKALIKSMEGVNDKAGSQKVMLDALRNSIGGVASEMNTGLTRETNRLRIAWDQLLETLGKTITPGATSSTGGLAAFLDVNRKLLSGEGFPSSGLDGKNLNLGKLKEPNPLGEFNPPVKFPGRSRGDMLSGITPEDVKAAQGRLDEQDRLSKEKSLELARTQTEINKKLLAERVKSIAEMIAASETEAAQLGKTTTEILLYNAAQKGATAVELERLAASRLKIDDDKEKKQQLDDDLKAEEAARNKALAITGSLKEQARAIAEQIDPQLALNDALKIYGEQLAKNSITQEEYNLLFDDSIGRMVEKTKTATSEMSEFAKRAAGNMQDSLADFLFDPFEKGLDGMLEGFLTTLRHMTAAAAAANILKSLGGNWMDSFSMNARGNVFDQSGAVAFARGGVINSPTLFPFANGIGLMGEAGPEAIMPLRRGPDGRLGVSGVGGMPVVVNVTVNVDANGSSVQVNAKQAAELGRTLGGAVRNVLIQEKRPGGLLS